MTIAQRCVRRATILLMSLLVLSVFAPSVFAAGGEKDCPEPTKPPPAMVPVTLRVALYPYTPDRLELFHKIEAIFECKYPGVNVVLVTNRNTTDKYYSHKDGEGFAVVDADVYEIDTILLADFIAKGKIAPIELPFQDFAPEGLDAVRRDGKIWGVPHWLCGNFLFHRKGDVEVANAKTWQELGALLAARKQRLLVDLKGKSTLGEWYLTALSQIVGLEEAQRQVDAEAPTNADAIRMLQDILRMCPQGYCRSESLHNNVGYYARAFVRGEAAVFLGYSEAMYYGLRETADNCLPGYCLTEDDIAVRPMPPFGAQGQAGLGWVDALAIKAGLSDDKKMLALKFIELVVSDEVYKSILTPEWPYRSRYLLPARQNLAIADAPLYKSLLEAHQGRKTGTFKGLNAKLRELADKSVDCRLPIDRDDQDTLDRCASK